MRLVCDRAHKAAWQRPAWLAALRSMMAHLAPRRAALSQRTWASSRRRRRIPLAAGGGRAGGRLSPGRISARDGMRFGIEVVRLAERNAWTLE